MVNENRGTTTEDAQKQGEKKHIEETLTKDILFFI